MPASGKIPERGARDSDASAPSPIGAAEANKRERDAAETQIGWKMAGLGMQVTSEVGAGALIGFLVDLWRGQGHTGVLVGAIAGICVGLFTLIRRSLALNRQLDRVAPSKGRGTPIPPRDPVDPDAETDPLWSRDDDEQSRST
ncbi:MAG: AtpZ/AtpI family protein [Phycisphaerae bacterium]|nr:AtpZ/AtpI family protein [Phycisphaerae bacterium]